MGEKMELKGTKKKIYHRKVFHVDVLDLSEHKKKLQRVQVNEIFSYTACILWRL